MYEVGTAGASAILLTLYPVQRGDGLVAINIAVPLADNVQKRHIAQR